jgi:hypothetical protein
MGTNAWLVASFFVGALRAYIQAMPRQTCSAFASTPSQCTRASVRPPKNNEAGTRPAFPSS